MKAMRLAAILLFPLFPTAAPAPRSGPMLAQGELTLTVLFDNIEADPRLQTGWGFSALLETPEHTLLFDTGADGDILLENMRLLGKDPRNIEAIVISHAHLDHTGGLRALLELGLNPRLFLLEAFPPALRGELGEGTSIVLSSRGEEVVPGVWSTGQVGTEIPEQALILETLDGPVVLTGCAHPGVVQMTRRAMDVMGGPVFEVLGGFHLGAASGETIRSVMQELMDLGVRKVGPTHCSGPQAMAIFQEGFGENYQSVGVGRVLKFPL
jgi:7,8-dihydropterin-6-yl-methyl-4-(beta-D-ribofuranosyl)aminobenzene 5'-phosphate synthase